MQKELDYLVALYFLVPRLLEVFLEGLYMPFCAQQKLQGTKRRNTRRYQPSRGSFEKPIMYGQI